MSVEYTEISNDFESIIETLTKFEDCFCNVNNWYNSKHEFSIMPVVSLENQECLCRVDIMLNMKIKKSKVENVIKELKTLHNKHRNIRLFGLITIINLNNTMEKYYYLRFLEDSENIVKNEDSKI